MFNKTFARYETNPNPYSTDIQRPGYTTTEQFEAAVVVDVIVNNTHTEYASDGYNVGAVKFRFINSGFFQPNETLHWAFPMDANCSEYPLLNELVYIFQGLNRFYYMKKFNVSNRPTSQGMFGLNEEAQPITNTKDNTKQLRSSAASPIKAPSRDKGGLGSYFVEPTNVYRLKHFEGDVIYEGRTGQSIRMGSSWIDGKFGITAKDNKKPWQALQVDQSPNLLIRVGPDPNAVKTVNTPYGQVIEDINADKSSIWIVSDQVIPLKYSTNSSPVHTISVSDFPNQLDGNQIVINTDRFVVNAKKNKLLFHSATGIHSTTLGDITLDTDKNHISWTSKEREDRVGKSWKITINEDYNKTAGRDIIQLSGRNHYIQSKKLLSFTSETVIIGSKTDVSEPIVLGSTLRNFLEQLIIALTSGPIVATTGSPSSPSPLNPSILTNLNRLKGTFLSGGNSSKILSQDNFVTRKNDKSDKPRMLEVHS